MELNPAHNPLLCPRTFVRREACACGICADRSTPEQKHAANKRDAEHLLNFVLSCLDNHESKNLDKPTWSDVAKIADIRRKLMSLAAHFVTSDNHSETEIAERTEIGLSVDDEEVMHELIAMTF